MSEQARKVLLDGLTDPPHIKLTNNGFDFSTQSILDSKQSPREGIFVCAIGSLPLFATADLSPVELSGSRGWLSFTRPIAEDHIELVRPSRLDLDQRIEVVDARTGCHLGHYFGRMDGYCINASALNFIPSRGTATGVSCAVESVDCLNKVNPFSWRPWDDVGLGADEINFPNEVLTPSQHILRKIIMDNFNPKDILLGAGCFWHVEFSLRRLPGVIATMVGYAGGSQSKPTYEDVFSGSTGHAEVVKVTFDPSVCDTRKLVDCWLAMHDPTMVRAHGKRATKTGQYRSCLFAFDVSTKNVALDAVAACQSQLGKEISSEVTLSLASEFWRAEDRYQRHDELRLRKRRSEYEIKIDQELGTLSFEDWIVNYGRRKKSVWGSSESIQVVPDDGFEDDGMARMMI